MLIRPSVRLSVLPATLSLVERFRFAAQLGFEGVEVDAQSAPPAELRDAAERSGVAIHSVHCIRHYDCPLSSPDPARVAAGVGMAVDAIRTASIVGADTLLLIPGMVGSEASYGEVYERSRKVIGERILPVAEEHRIILGIENVWNGFLLGPVDFARYIDDFGSPRVRAYLDVGNLIFGHPEGWIELLGPRICALHLKDSWFDPRRRRFGYAKIGAGDIDWVRVRAALERIGYSGWGVLAEPDMAQSAIAKRLYHRVMKRTASGGLAAWVLRTVQTDWARRLLGDVMRRFRREICPPGRS